MKKVKVLIVIPRHGHLRMSCLERSNEFEITNFRIDMEEKTAMIEKIKNHTITLGFNIVVFDFFSHVHDNLEMAQKLEFALDQFALISIISGKVKFIEFGDEAIIIAPKYSTLSGVITAAKNLDRIKQTWLASEL